MIRMTPATAPPNTKESTMKNLPLDPTLRTQIDETFGRFFAEGAAGPGLAYGIVRGGQVVHAVGLGTAEAGVVRTVDADTVFRIASMSKSFTAVAILQLRDAGALGLDDAIARWVPAFVLVPGQAADAPALTIRHCLSMSGGLPTDDPWADRQESLASADFESLLAAGVRFVNPPGVAYEYSNLGFALLGQVVEKASGMTFVDFVRTRILQPLGLASTYYDYADVATETLAIGHRTGVDGPIAVPFTEPGAFSAIGGALSSVRDIALWLDWLADAFSPRGAAAAANETVLSRASRREMQQLHRIIPGEGAAGYGYGLFIEEHVRWGPIAQHSGGYPGFGSHMRWHARTGWGVIAFGNKKYAPVSRPAAEALELVLAGTHEPASPLRIWDAVGPARAAIERVLNGQDDAHTDPIFSPNVLLDEPAAERVNDLRAVLAVSGPVISSEAISVSAPTPARLEWVLPCERGSLRLELRMTPTTPPLVHSYTVRASRG